MDPLKMHRISTMENGLLWGGKEQKNKRKKKYQQRHAGQKEITNPLRLEHKTHILLVLGRRLETHFSPSQG